MLAFLPNARVCVHGSSPTFFWKLTTIASTNIFNSIKKQGFVAEIFAILTIPNHQFLKYFAYFHSFSPPKATKMDDF